MCMQIVSSIFCLFQFKGPLKQMVGVINMLLVKHLIKIADEKLSHFSNLKVVEHFYDFF